MSKLRTEQFVKNNKKTISALAQKAHEESIFKEIQYSEEKFSKSFDTTINDPYKYLGLKVSIDNKILGFAYCMAGGYYIGEGAKVVTVNTIYVDKPIRNTLLGGRVAVKLIRGIETWARDRKAQYILYHVTSGAGIASADKFFRKMGMTTLGGNYGVKL